MKLSRRNWWYAYAAGAVALLIALSWVTTAMLRLEAAELRARQAELRARQDVTEQASIGLALWNMDSWMVPLLAREAARPYFEYLPLYSQEGAYTKLLSSIEEGEVMTISPLLSARPEYIRLFFQIDAKGEVTSPQVPSGNQRDLAEGYYVQEEDIRASTELLESMKLLIEPLRLVDRQREAASRLAGSYSDAEHWACNTVTPQDPVAVQTVSRGLLYKQAVDLQNQLPLDTRIPAAGARVQHGPLLPLWAVPPEGCVDPRDPQELLFLREIQVGGEKLFQGFWVDWPRLRQALLDRVGWLASSFDGAELVPVFDSQQPPRGAMATVPARLVVHASSPPQAVPASPARWTLAITWAAVCLAILGAGVTLRAAISYGEKRSRFASAVTHELRTPLTTFSIYSDMLASGMVQGEEQRQKYYETLRAESNRLASLVENVLAYARLEDGRVPCRRQRTTVAQLVERARADLERRAEKAGLPLDLRCPPEVGAQALDADGEAVAQILFNLVDNACKYGAPAAGAPASIELEAELAGDHLELRVRDHGEGVPARKLESIFTAFDRGGRTSADPIPGIGLGLALARGLARDQGGDLSVGSSQGGGATFTLTLPLAEADRD